MDKRCSLICSWKRDERGEMARHEGTGHPILQFLAIERRDNHEWAIPGVCIASTVYTLHVLHLSTIAH